MTVSLYKNGVKIIKSNLLTKVNIYLKIINIKRVLVSNVIVNGERVIPKIEIGNYVSDVTIE